KGYGDASFHSVRDSRRDDKLAPVIEDANHIAIVDLPRCGIRFVQINKRFLLAFDERRQMREGTVEKGSCRRTEQLNREASGKFRRALRRFTRRNVIWHRVNAHLLKSFRVKFAFARRSAEIALGKRRKLVRDVQTLPAMFFQAFNGDACKWRIIA